MKIEVKELVKSFDGFHALDGVSLNVPEGAVYGLVGPNGAGKSTIIRHLTGIYHQDSGEVLVDGQPVYENNRIKSRMAYIPDEVFYYTQASIKDMMQFYSSIYPSFSRERFDRMGKVFDMDINRPMRKLSKGMQKQVAFRLALSLCPDIVVLDEPVDGLDPVMRRQVWNILLSDIAEHGTTVVVSSHNLRELEDICDHVGIMNKGKMCIERSLSDLQDSIVKIQIAVADGVSIPEGLDILHVSSVGRVQQLIVRGRSEDVMQTLSQCNPLLLDTVPLTLEEIFIYEMGGAGYEIKDIII